MYGVLRAQPQRQLAAYRISLTSVGERPHRITNNSSLGASASTAAAAASADLYRQRAGINRPTAAGAVAAAAVQSEAAGDGCWPGIFLSRVVLRAGGFALALVGPCKDSPAVIWQRTAAHGSMAAWPSLILGSTGKKLKARPRGWRACFWPPTEQRPTRQLDGVWDARTKQGPISMPWPNAPMPQCQTGNWLAGLGLARSVSLLTLGRPECNLFGLELPHSALTALLCYA